MRRPLSAPIHIVGLLCMIGLIWLIGFYGGRALLADLVTPSHGTIDAWLKEYARLINGLTIVTAVIAVGWFSYTHWKMRVVDPKSASPKPPWVVALGLALAAGVAAAMMTPPTSNGGMWLFLIMPAVAIAGFYVATVLFAPVGHKFTAPLSHRLRRWW